MDSTELLPQSILNDINRILNSARHTPDPQLVALSIALSHSDVIGRLLARQQQQQPLLSMRCDPASQRARVMRAVFAFGEGSGQPRLVPDAFAVDVDLDSQDVEAVRDPYLTIYGGITERQHKVHVPYFAGRSPNDGSRCCGDSPNAARNRSLIGTTSETIRLEVTSPGATVNQNTSGDVVIHNASQTQVVLQNGSYLPIFGPPVGTVLISLPPGATASVSRPSQGTPAWESTLVRYEIYDPCWPPGPVIICTDPIVVTPTSLDQDAIPGGAWPPRVNVAIRAGGGLGLTRP